MTKTTLKRLRDLLAEEPEEWYIKRESLDCPDETYHFTHVMYTTHEYEGHPMTVRVAGYVSDDLAELLVTTKNNLAEMLRLAEIGLETEMGAEDKKPRTLSPKLDN